MLVSWIVFYISNVNNPWCVVQAAGGRGAGDDSGRLLADHDLFNISNVNNPWCVVQAAGGRGAGDDSGRLPHDHDPDVPGRQQRQRLLLQR